ncbi:TetR/AcrR family transcriptional regulator [Microbacterium pygmaeum]|uniref:DNA-binding transcriptional regulator, AcrR family n=1 Tax=Microbacterium pygmaeum TaxID=370764 RepID=A0A1G7WYC0_9MICO|nr:TetR family transcriptional regulator [Microbacterium pygmaeum]SDG76929.1 DNA-binding transcriptional regulator, AcrR family [Microbacterium pygmaeum]
MTDVLGATTRRREATRQKLLDAAAQLFAEEGLDAASVEAICERAGFTRGAFYSNFETKDELFLELCGRVARARVAAVRGRVAALEGDAQFPPLTADPLAIVRQILEVTADDRLGILLMSEIRINALRNPQLGAAYLAQDAELSEGVTQIVTDVAQAAGLKFRIPPAEAARLMLTVWESEATRGVMSGAEDAELSRRTSEGLARVAQLIIEPPLA